MAETKTEHVVKITADTSDVSSKMTKADKELENLDKKGKNAGSTFSQLGKKLSEAFSSFGTSKATESMSQGMDLLQRKTERLQAQLKALGENKISTTEYSQLQSELTKAEQALSRYTAKQEKMSALGVTQESQSWKSVQYDINKTTSEIERLENAMSDMRNNDTAFQTAELLPTKEYEKAISVAEKAEKALLKLYDRQEIMAISYKGMEDKMRSSQAFKNLQYQIEKAERELEAFESDVAHMEEDGTAYKYKIDTSDFGKLQSQIKQTEAQMDTLANSSNTTGEAISQGMSAAATATDNLSNKSGLMSSIVETLQSRWSSMTSNLGVVGSAIDTVTGKLDSASKALNTASQAAASFSGGSGGLSIVAAGALKVASALTSVISVALKVGKTILSGVVSVFQKLLSVLKSVASAALNVGKKLLKAFGSAMLKPLQKVLSGITNIGKALIGLNKDADGTSAIIKKLTDTFTSFATMLISRFKRLAVSAVFEDLTENFGKLATISESFNTSVSSMIDSAKQLGAQLVASVEPIVSAVGPIISQFTDMLSGAADTLAQFTARLTGNTTYVKATKGVSDYKSSLDDTTDSTKDATKATKEYQNTVLGFDKLNKMNSSSEATTVVDDDGSSITGISTATIGKAETQATRLNEIADTIYKAFTRKDFSTAGKTMGKAVNEAFGWLSDVAGWDKNATKITKVVGNITDTINGFFNGLDGSQVGNTIGDVLNSVVEIIKMITDPVSGINFGAIGEDVGQIIISAVKKINTKDLGMAIMQALQGGIDFLNGLLEQNPGTALGDAIADMFSGAVEAIKPEKWSDVISNLWNNLWDMIIGIFQSPEDWEQLGIDLAEIVNQVFEKADPTKMATGISNIADALGSMIGNFIDNIDWDAAFSWFDTAWSSLREKLSPLVEQFFEYIKSKWENDFKPWISAEVGDILSQAIDVVVDHMSEKWEEALQGLFGWAMDLGEWMNKNIFDPLWNVIDYFFKTPAEKGYTLVWDEKEQAYVKSQISHNANGGIIGDGQLFIANEGGTAELIGADDNGNTAVVNNTQIISAVVSGVKQGVMQAIVNSGMTKQQESSGGDIVLQVDSEELARATYKGQKRWNKRTNAQVSFA